MQAERDIFKTILSLSVTLCYCIYLVSPRLF